jgi:hypothetical protein
MDNHAGVQLGKSVAEAFITRAQGDGSQHDDSSERKAAVNGSSSQTLQESSMSHRTIAGAAGALAALLLIACASTPQQAADAREQKTYRTGSNIPSKDYGAANIDVSTPDIVNPIKRPIVMKPGR